MLKQTELYKCRIFGNKIMWGVQNANGADWFHNVNLFYSIDGDNLTIYVVESDGSKKGTNYSIKSLKNLSK